MKRLLLFAAVVAMLTPGVWSQTFNVGDSVQIGSAAVDCLNARSAPAINSTVYNCEKVGVKGLVVGGPTSTSDGYTWWEIQYPDVTGWSSGKSLVKVGTTPPVTLPTVTLSVSPMSLIGSGAVSLSYSVSSNATGASIDNGVGTVTGSGTKTGIAVSATTTFTLTATNRAGSKTATATVTVVPPIATSCDTAYRRGFVDGQALAVHDTISSWLTTHDTLYSLPDSLNVILTDYWGGTLVLTGKATLKK